MFHSNYQTDRLSMSSMTNSNHHTNNNHHNNNCSFLTNENCANWAPFEHVSCKNKIEPNNYYADSPYNTTTEVNPLDIDEVLKSMDNTYSTKFCDNVHNEANVEQIAANLKRVIDDYTDVERISKGIRWIVSGWDMHNIAYLLVVVSRNWPLSKFSQVASLVTNDWPLFPSTQQFLNILLKQLLTCWKLEEVISFLVFFTSTWSVNSSLEILVRIQVDLKLPTDLYFPFSYGYLFGIQQQSIRPNLTTSERGHISQYIAGVQRLQIHIRSR
eukprot:Awhi_evm1s5107